MSEKMTKTALIEKYVALDPFMAPCDIQQRIKKERGISIPSSTLSGARKKYLESIGPTEERRTGNGHAYVVPKRTPPGAQMPVAAKITSGLNGFLEDLETLRDVVNKFGGKENTVKLISMLNL